MCVPNPRVLLLALLLGAGAAAPAAEAQTVTPQGAAELAAAIEEGLRRAMPQDPEGGVTYEFDGEVRAIPAGDRYHVRLPRIAILPNAGSQTEIGTIELDVKPLPDGRYDFAAVLPSSVSFYGPEAESSEDTVSGEILIGRQRIQGIWLPQAETITGLDAELGDLRLALDDGSQPIAIGTLSMTLDLQEEAPAAWGGPFDVVLESVHVDGDAGETVLDLDRLTMDGRYAGVDLVGLTQWGREMEAFMSDPATLDGMETMGPAELVRTLLAPVAGMIGGLETRMALEGLRLVDAESRAAVDRLQASWGFDGLREDFSSVWIGYRHDGLVIEPAPEGSEGLMPETVEISVTADHLPNAALGAAILRFADAAAAADEDTAAMMFGQQALQAMAEAGSEVRLDGLQYVSQLIGARAQGVLLLDVNAVNQFVATLEATLRGLDDAMQAFAPAPGQEPDEDTQGVLMMLGMLNAMGQPVQDAEGRTTRNYRIEVMADGRITLNGADMGSILQGMQGGAEGDGTGQ